MKSGGLSSSSSSLELGRLATPHHPAGSLVRSGTARLPPPNGCSAGGRFRMVLEQLPSARARGLELNIKNPQLSASTYAPVLEPTAPALPADELQVALHPSEWQAIPDMWRTAAAKFGDRVALVDLYHNPPSRITYNQLEQDILNFAQGLRVVGVNPAEKLALFADNSCRWLIADQGIMATGAVNVVRGTRSSDEELLKIYTHSDSVALVVDNPSFFNRLSETLFSSARIRFVVLLWGEKANLNKLPKNAPVFTYDEIAHIGRNSRHGPQSSAAAGRRRPPPYEIKPDDVATLLYTSGTSSAPKGVMLTHRNFLHQIRSLWDHIPAEAGDRFLSMCPPWHVFERTAEYFMFSRGVEQVYTNVKNWKADLQKYQPDYLFSVPLIYETLQGVIQKQISASSAAQQLVARTAIKISLAYMEAKRVHEGKVLTDKKQQALLFTVIVDWLRARITAAILWPLHALAMKLVYQKFHTAVGIKKAGVCGGGSLSTHIDKFFEAIGVTLKNGYGLTETSSISFRLPDRNVLGIVGHPIKQTEVKIVDAETGRVLSDGSKGLIKIRGPQVMKGYYKDPSTTKKAVDADGWFDTGDLGWVAPNNPVGRSRHASGALVVEGRAKHTIVLSSGKNVEPSEIEEAAMRSSLIKQIMVIGQDQRRLGALIVPNEEEIAPAIGKLTNDKSLSSNEVMRIIRKEVAIWTTGCSFQIGPILLLDEPFTTENGLMTPTMKVRREQVSMRYKDQIARLYQQDA